MNDSTQTEGVAYSAHVFPDINSLFSKQRDAAEFILTKIQAIAEEEAEIYKNFHGNREHYLKKQTHRRPRHVFTIRGKRGTGKTALMLTLHNLMAHVGN